MSRNQKSEPKTVFSYTIICTLLLFRSYFLANGIYVNGFMGWQMVRESRQYLSWHLFFNSLPALFSIQLSLSLSVWLLISLPLRSASAFSLSLSSLRALLQQHQLPLLCPRRVHLVQSARVVVAQQQRRQRVRHWSGCAWRKHASGAASLAKLQWPVGLALAILHWPVGLALVILQWPVGLAFAELQGTVVALAELYGRKKMQLDMHISLTLLAKKNFFFWLK